MIDDRPLNVKYFRLDAHGHPAIHGPSPVALTGYPGTSQVISRELVIEYASCHIFWLVDSGGIKDDRKIEGYSFSEQKAPNLAYENQLRRDKAEF